MIDFSFFDEYQKHYGKRIEAALQETSFQELKDEKYHTAVSAVFSANIEGNSLDINSFMNSRILKEKFAKPKEAKEIEDLVAAYDFAKEHALTEENFLRVHKILSRHLLIPVHQGKYRDDKVGVFGTEGLVYMAVEAEHLEEEMQQLFTSIEELQSKKLTPVEALYSASFLHLRIAHIHPFFDGNGRLARIVEKWMLTELLGREWWNISSEAFYRKQQWEYYQNINLGVNDYELDYSRCIPFLGMLAQALIGASSEKK